MGEEPVESVVLNCNATFSVHHSFSCGGAGFEYGPEGQIDKNVNKIGNGSKLEDYPLAKLPQYLKNNIEKYKNWLS